MKIFFGMLVFLSSSVIICAQPATTSCPEITVTVPSGLTKPGDSITFTANIGKGRPDNPGYAWSVSMGTIVSGQGTATIKVQTTEEMAGMNVTAAVKVPGVGIGCSDTASETAGVAVDPICQCSADEFGMLSKSDVRARIDNFYIRLQNDHGMEGFMLVRLNEKENRAVQKRFLNSIYDAIVRLKKDPSRVTFLISVDKSETNTTLYLVPVGAGLPTTDKAFTLIEGEEFKQKIKTLFSKTK